MDDYLIRKIQYTLEEHIFIRPAILESCKSQSEKDKWLDRWSQKDSAEKIADAIDRASTHQRKLRMFGLF